MLYCTQYWTRWKIHQAEVSGCHLPLSPNAQSCAQSASVFSSYKLPYNSENWLSSNPDPMPSRPTWTAPEAKLNFVITVYYNWETCMVVPITAHLAVPIQVSADTNNDLTCIGHKATMECIPNPIQMRRAPAIITAARWRTVLNYCSCAVISLENVVVRIVDRRRCVVVNM